MPFANVHLDDHTGVFRVAMQTEFLQLRDPFAEQCRGQQGFLVGGPGFKHGLGNNVLFTKIEAAVPEQRLLFRALFKFDDGFLDGVDNILISGRLDDVLLVPGRNGPTGAGRKGPKAAGKEG